MPDAPAEQADTDGVVRWCLAMTAVMPCPASASPHTATLGLHRRLRAAPMMTKARMMRTRMMTVVPNTPAITICWPSLRWGVGDSVAHLLHRGVEPGEVERVGADLCLECGNLVDYLLELDAECGDGCV